jgi:predicted phosphohydrolase
MARTLLVTLVLCAIVALAFGDLAFTVIGDWGVKLSYTNVIAARSQKEKSKFCVAIGDNFYKNGQPSHGVASVDDPKWQSIFEQQFNQPFWLNKKFHVIAGNHDYDGNEQAQIAYTKKSKRWHFPSRYYTVKDKAGKGVSVELIMTDSQVINNDDQELSAYGVKRDLKQIKWIGNTLKRSKATWKIIFAHHPIYHSKGKNEWVEKKLVHLFEKYHVAAFVSGHLHNFQHLRSAKGKVHYITIGNTGIQVALPKPKKSPGGVKIVKLYPTTEQFSSCGSDGCKGFGIFKIKDKRKMSVEIFNSKNNKVYSIPITNSKK